MIGDVPKGAPIRCRLGFHKRKPDEGLLCYYCDRCDGTYWQDRPGARAALTAVEVAESHGNMDEAKRIHDEWIQQK